MEATAEAVPLPGDRRWIGRVALAALVGAGVLALAVAGAVLTGHRALIVKSGSMSPAIETGDLVLVSSVLPTEVAPDDIVTFRDPGRDQELVTHRVVEARRGGGEVAFVTKGDANTGIERWSIDVQGTIGQVAFRVPKAGYLLAWLGTPVVRVAMLALAALLLAFVALRRIWA